MKNTGNEALIVVDVQRGFMPETEGGRLKLEGFGELAVPEGEQVIAPINRMLVIAAELGHKIISTQDKHPRETAHFAPAGTAPNFRSNWPVHCVAGTPGTELHPDLVLPNPHTRFIKGTERLVRGEDDHSYSGYYAHDPITGITLPAWLKEQQVEKVTVVGLAFDHCVGQTALHAATRLNLDTTVAMDATRSVAPYTEAAMMAELEAAGVHFTTSAAWEAERQVA